MSFADNPYEAPRFDFAAQAAVNERAGFIAKTYLHLTGAILAFIAIEAALLQSPLPERMMALLAGSPYSWLIVLGGFMVVSWLAHAWASSDTSVPMQYLGLSLYVVAQAFIFVPLLYIANKTQPGVIAEAALATLLLFGGMTAVVFITRKDFSFMRGFLMFAGFAAIAFIIGSIVTGFSLGWMFSVAMIVFACGYILYDTSNVLHHYRIGQHVAAALALFASVALLFWYVLQLFMSRE
ncbi:MAG: permease [Planctomycetota bacterium]|nr:MAG: permease [Planctomycetota bacterium]REJ93306.1 MAG: permease [Planctomycetota bacterium]REK30292.1 MAG: permease [Planctomycetota bacterium]REK49251.1 MAG: permease [Planctomycetota bacterium]